MNNMNIWYQLLKGETSALYNLTMVILVCAPNLNAVSIKKFTVGRLEKNKEY